LQNLTREGILYGLGAYIWWGMMPLYFRWLGKVSPFDILAHRIAWSAVFLVLLVTMTGRWRETLRAIRTRNIVLPLVASAVLVAYNWLMYILGVHFRMVVQASLGYFILPLVSVALGVVIFHERLRPLQQLAIVFAAVGVALLTLTAGEFPWLALALAVSFSFYGMIRKKVPVDGLIGLAVETFVLLPIALAYLAISYEEGSDWVEPGLLFRLSLSGIVTAIPLLCFGQAARRLPFSMLGFMQYISPSLQFLLAVFVLHENVVGGWMNYSLVWAALLIFTLDSVLWYRRQSERVQTA
jgi:chloramphenicol-sensitive protein RarD